MKIRINTQVIESLKPCADRLVVWRENYKDFDGDILEFLQLEKMSARDKIWVTVRVIPKFSVELCAIYCAFYAYEVAAAARTQEYENQVDALIMLIKEEGEL